MTDTDLIDQIIQLVATARDLDIRGKHTAADAIDFRIAAVPLRKQAQVQSTPKAQTQQFTEGYPSAANYPPTNSFMGSLWTNANNTAGAWVNQAVLHNNQRNIQMLSERIIGLRQDIAQNANQLPMELIQAMCAVLDKMAQLISPYVQQRSAGQNQTLRRIRHSGVGDISGLEGMIDSLKTLTEQILSNVNPVLERSLLSQIAILKNYLGQFEEGVAGGYAANYQAQQYARNSQYDYPIASQTKPAEGLSPRPQQQQSGDWYSDNGTTRELFLARCRAWGDANNGISALKGHLEDNSIPQDVLSDALRDYGENGKPSGFAPS